MNDFILVGNLYAKYIPKVACAIDGTNNCFFMHALVVSYAHKQHAFICTFHGPTSTAYAMPIT